MKPTRIEGLKEVKNDLSSGKKNSVFLEEWDPRQGVGNKCSQAKRWKEKAEIYLLTVSSYPGRDSPL